MLMAPVAERVEDGPLNCVQSTLHPGVTLSLVGLGEIIVEWGRTSGLILVGAVPVFRVPDVFVGPVRGDGTIVILEDWKRVSFVNLKNLRTARTIYAPFLKSLSIDVFIVQ